MNYTPNHHLPQWVSSDRVRMEDFNSAMANIESGLSTNASNTAAAQSTATQARSAALAAYSPDNKPYVIGTYTGKSANQKITLDFRPSFLVISGMATGMDPDSHDTFDQYFAMGTGKTLSNRLITLPDGFIVYRVGYEGACQPVLNEPDRTYEYIAFR